MKTKTDGTHLLAPLRAAIAEGERMNLSLHELCKRAKPPADTATIYRWLSGGGEPGLFLFAAVVKALEEFNAAERARIAGTVKLAPMGEISLESPPPEWLA